MRGKLDTGLSNFEFVLICEGFFRISAWIGQISVHSFRTTETMATAGCFSAASSSPRPFARTARAPKLVARHKGVMVRL